MASEKITKIIDDIKALSVIELKELVDEVCSTFGVSAAAPVAAAGASAAVAAVVEEKTEFDVILKDIGAEKIKVIKVVRELTGLGLKEAKDLVDTAPKPVKEGISKADADSIVEKFKEVGATCEVK